MTKDLPFRLLHRPWVATLLCCCALAATSGCERGPKNLEGAWLGEGKFFDLPRVVCRVQLELLGDGTYRFLVLQPGVLALAGPETGNWRQDGDRLHLEPFPPEAPDQSAPMVVNTEEKNPLKIMGSARKPGKPRELKIEKNLSALTLSDSMMDVSFKPNPEVSKKLAEEGR